MAEDFDASRELRELIVQSLELGLDNLRESGSLIPMVVSVKDNDCSLCVLTSESALDAAASYLAALPAEPDRYVVIFNGQIGDGNEVWTSAVIAHAGERGGLHAYEVAHSYDLETFSALGKPEYVGRADQLLGRLT